LLAILRQNQRQFSTNEEKPKTTDEKSQPNEPKVEEKEDKKETKSNKNKTNEDNEQEFHHEEENSANFSFRRKLLFAIGKAIKYSIWTYFALFTYHYYLVRKREKPEESFG